MKTFNYFFSIVLMLVVIGFVSCGDDDSNGTQEEVVDTTDPNAVSDAVEIANAKVNQGNPPAPSSDAAAPKIYEEVENQAVTNGSSFFLDIGVESGDIAGAYVKVVGSDEYFDISKDDLASNSGGRIGDLGGRKGRNVNGRGEEDEDFGLAVKVPGNIQPGEFCMEYCIYDSENRVSNVIEVCIEVLEFGGTNSDFLTANDWSLIYSKDTYDGVTDIDSVGVERVTSFETIIDCGDGTQQEVLVETIYREDYLYVAFKADGTFTTEGKDYSKDFDYENSNCESGAAFTEKEDLDSEEGTWSYDDTAKELVILTIDEEYAETFFVKFKVTQADDLLILDDNTIDEPGAAYQVAFKKRQ